MLGDIDQAGDADFGDSLLRPAVCGATRERGPGHRLLKPQPYVANDLQDNDLHAGADPLSYHGTNDAGIVVQATGGGVWTPG